jgi:hypothetical protein
VGDLLYFSTVCVVDDDAKTFELHFTVRTRALVTKASTAVARGRRLCCYVLRGGAEELEREERFLASRGYKRGEVRL